MPIEWIDCKPISLVWFSWREPLLYVLFTPWLLSLFAGLLITALTVVLSIRLSWLNRSLIVISAVLSVNIIYSPLATQWLSVWLSSQLPQTFERAEDAPRPVAVLLGRGAKIGRATSRKAAQLLNDHKVEAVYVSGDRLSTAQRVVKLGAPAERVAGDSCARTTWQNATRTNAWLQRNHPEAPVLLITDPWQLPRAAHAFAGQGLNVMPMAISPQLNSRTRNRIALRETAGTLLYRLQGRM